MLESDSWMTHYDGHVHDRLDSTCGGIYGGLLTWFARQAGQVYHS